MRSRRALGLAALLPFLATAPASPQPAPSGPEIRVGTAPYVSASDLGRLRAAGHPGGGFTLVWRAGLDSPGAYPFHARRFAADGTPRTAEIAVGAGSTPGITAVGDGFVVFGLQGGLARRFDPSGRPLGSPFAVAGGGAAADDQGNFATAVADPGHVSLFRYSAAGELRGETAVPVVPVSFRRDATVARAPHGEMLVAWKKNFLAFVTF